MLRFYYGLSFVDIERNKINCLEKLGRFLREGDIWVCFEGRIGICWKRRSYIIYEGLKV